MSEREVPAPVADPVAGADPVAAADRTVALQRLRDLVATAEISVDRFTSAVELVLTAQRYAEVEAVMAAMPPPVRVTPAARRLGRPLEIDAGMGTLELAGDWQLAAETSVRTLTGRCRIDLTQASWDATDVDLRLHTEMGEIDVIVPQGVAVRIVSAGGGLRLDPLARAAPGAPRINIDASGRSGRILVRNPSRSRWRRWLAARRRRSARRR